MIFIINVSNLNFGGGVQVALSFLNELKSFHFRHTYHIFTSITIYNQLDKNTFPNNFIFYKFDKSSGPLRTRKKIISKLNNLEKIIQPNIVFTVFGPSYWKPKSKHLMGFADGWVYNPDTIAYTKLSFFEKIKRKLYCEYKKFYLKKDADYYILETEDAKHKFSKILGIDLNKITVIGNTYSEVFNDKKLLEDSNQYYIKLPKKAPNEFRFLYIAHNHPAKNISVIKKVIPFLPKNIKFFLTIDTKSYNYIFTDNNTEVINLGPININSCPSLYEQCDALFAPTLLETFSASYPESMKMNIPILTSEYSFAKDLCQDAAVYFNPLDVKDILDKILLLINSENTRSMLIEKGFQRLKNFESAQSRAMKYIQLCEKIA